MVVPAVSTLSCKTKEPTPVNGRPERTVRCSHFDGSMTQPFSHTVMRNPKLFYEAAFIARPRLQDALHFRNSPRRNQPSDLTHQHYQPAAAPTTTVHSEKVTAHSPPSSTGTGYAGSSGLSTPDSLKGNLRRKDNPVEGRDAKSKKHVQFNLQLKHVVLDDSSSSGEEDGTEEFDEIERSLMQGYREYDELGALTNGHAVSSKRKPGLRLDFGGVTANKANPPGDAVKGEQIDAELPLDQQTWYFGAISRTEAEDILRNCTECSYIVRACELANRRDYSLAIKSSCGFMHLRIHRQPDDLYRLADFNRVFFTIPDLIEYYSCENLPIRGNPTVLLHPVHQQLL